MKQKYLTLGFILLSLGLLGFLSVIITKQFPEASGILIWLIDLAANWQILYLGLFLVGVAILAFRNWKYLVLLPLASLPWLTASEMAPRSISAAEPLKVATANINFQNNNLQPLLEWINQTDADVVVLIELSPEAAKELNQLKQYPHKLLYPDDSPFGIGVLSKHYFRSFDIERGNQDIPTLKSIITWNSNDINFVAFHPMPPIAPEYHSARNQKLMEIINTAEESGLPTIIAGDFNATPWSSTLTTINLKRATGLQPTWIFRYFGIPMDQVLVSGHWNVVDTSVGEGISSDHFPVITKISLAKTR